MNDLFLSKEIIDAYLVDLVARLYRAEDAPAPDVLCAIGTSGQEVCDAILTHLPDNFKSSVGLVDIDLDRSLNGGVIYYSVDSDNQLSTEEVVGALSGKTVLLIDGLVYSGGTLKRAYDAVHAYKPKGIISYGTVTRVSSCIIPNYFSVLIGKHDRACLRFKNVQEFPNKRFDGFGCVRLASYKQDARQPLPVAATGDDSKFKTWQDISVLCRDDKSACYVFETAGVIQGYVVFRIEKTEPVLFINTLIVGAKYKGLGIGGNLWRWMDTFAGANRLELLKVWVSSKDFDFYEKLGFFFAQGNRPDGVSGAMMLREVPYRLPYGKEL